MASLGRRNACMRILAKVPLETALLAYISLLTLSEEVSCIWKKKWKLGTALYLLARYGALLYIVTEKIILFFNFQSLQVCFFHLTFIDAHR